MKTKLFVLLLVCILKINALASSFAADPQNPTTKESVNVSLNLNEESTLIRMGNIEIILPNRPRLQPDDIPKNLNLADVENDFAVEFMSLNEAEKQLYFENRLIFLKGAAQLFNSIKYGVFGLNWIVDSTQTTKQVLKENSKKAWSFSKDKITKAWQNILPKYQPVSEFEIATDQQLPDSQVESLSSAELESKIAASSESVKNRTDLIRQTFVALNKIYFKNARLVAKAVEFGLTIGLGVSGNVGFRKTDAAWAIGGLTDLLLHISYRPSTQTFIINLQSLNELATHPLTKISVVGGIDVRFGAHFKNNDQSSLTKGQSSYPSNGVFGTSIYSDRIISWIVTEFNPFILSDLSGFSTQGLAINLLTVEGSKLYPLFFKAGKDSVLGQVLHFFADSIKAQYQSSRCEFLF